MAEVSAVPPSDQCFSLRTGGYDCDFVEPLPDSLTCPVCLLGLRDPHLLDCCGVKICATCVGRIDAASQPCPHCRETFMHILDKSINRQVLDRKVRCSKKEDGCEWEGELRHLDKHESEECGWAFVQCRYQCGGRVSRRQLAEHEHEECPLRPMNIKIESFMHKMEEKLTSEKECHQREMTAEREEFKRTLQEEQEKHKKELETKWRTHAARMQQLEQMMARKLDEQKKEYEAKIEQLVQSLQRKLRADTEQQVVELRKEMEEKVIPQCAMVNEMRVYLFGHPILPPCEFTMTGYYQHKRSGDRWYSPPFYSGLGGYKMCLRVNAKGIDTGIGVGIGMPVGIGFFSGTHVSVYVHLLKGEHDEKLRWPFQGNITVQLVNQKKDWEHVEYDVYYSGASGARVFKGQCAPNGLGIARFIAHTALETTTGTTQYIHNDCLKWRVIKIVHSF